MRVAGFLRFVRRRVAGWRTTRQIGPNQVNSADCAKCPREFGMIGKPERRCVSLLLLMAFASARAATPDAAIAPDAQTALSGNAADLGTIHVIAVTPQQGADLPEAMIPYNVQSTTSGELDRTQTSSITDYMNRNLTGVTINSATANPLQPNLQFRGFTASPLLGGSEGVSVYLDGVRINEVFGDSVNWDLIPEEMISTMSVISGANPVFGLNTLGGAIQIRSKDGFSDPGLHAELSGGSFGRTESTIQGGNSNGTWGYYLLANHFEESGWRDYSNSNATGFLSTFSWRGDDASADLHLAHAETKLNGNGASPIEAVAIRPQSVFTAPDRTQNYYSLVSGQGSYRISAESTVSATLFKRQVDTRSYNGDASDFGRCDDDIGYLCNQDGSQVVDQSGNRVGSNFDAINNIGVRKQLSYGGSLQWVDKHAVFGARNQFAAGVDYDHGRVGYTSVLELANLIVDPNLPLSSITSANSGVFVPADALSVYAYNVNVGAYATDTLSLSDKLALTASVRYNHTHSLIEDTGGANPDLNGEHRFLRFNPALGLTYQWNPALNFYGGYSESTRAPTAVELACASPDAPCKLPNEFVADPPLRQVVAKNWESGLRGTFDGGWFGATRWKAGLFRTTNVDDIVFQATGGAQSNEGFFANIGDTRRQGAEASISGKAFDNRIDWFINYTHLDARFLSAFTEISANHPQADPDTGLIAVEKGDRLPGLPQNTMKLGADYALTPALTLGGDIVYNSAQYFRGDEANLLPPIGGFMIVNLRAVYRIGEHFSTYLRAQNVFDRRYADFGVVGSAANVLPQFTDPRLLSPGGPRAAWLGVSFDL
jgi:iron complex outermembrane receptor protein